MTLAANTIRLCLQVLAESLLARKLVAVNNCLASIFSCVTFMGRVALVGMGSAPPQRMLVPRCTMPEAWRATLGPQQQLHVVQI